MKNFKIFLLIIISQFSFSQSKFERLVNAFDTNNLEEKIQLIKEIELEGFDNFNTSDLNLFKLIKLESIGYSDNKYLTQEFSDYFKSSLNYFLEKNLYIDFLPFFLNKYALLYYSLLDEDVAKFFLEKSISIETQNKNLSIKPSRINQYDSFEFLGIIDTVEFETHLSNRLNLFKENKDLMIEFLIPYRINSIIDLISNANSTHMFNYLDEKDLVNEIIDLSIENINQIGNTQISIILEMAIIINRKKDINILTQKLSETLSSIKDTDSLEYYLLLISGYQYYYYIGRLDLAYVMVLDVMNHRIYKENQPILIEDPFILSGNPSEYYANFDSINSIKEFEYKILVDFMKISIAKTFDDDKKKWEQIRFFNNYAIESSEYFYKIGALSKENYLYYSELFNFIKVQELFYTEKFDKILELDFKENYFKNDIHNYWYQRTKLIANYELDEINYNDFSNKINSLRNKFDYNLDAFDFFYLNPNAQIVEQRIKNLKDKLLDIDFINNLSYENQISHFDGFYGDFDLLIGDLIEVDVSQDLLFDVFQILIDLDNIDKYNSKLLNLNVLESDKYFELLNRRREISTDNFFEFNKETFEFDNFQQTIKSKLLNQERITLKEFQEKLKDDEVYIRIFKKLGYTEQDIDNYYGFLYSKNKISLIKFDEIEYEKIRDLYISSMLNEIKDDISFEFLFKPILDELTDQVSKIYIKNDGIFNSINIETLLLKNEDQLLIDKYEVEYIEKPLSIFRKKDLDIKSAFLFGNPLFDSNIRNTIRSNISELPNTKIEIDKISELLLRSGIKITKTDREKSNEKNLYDNSNSNIIHIATHGFYGDKPIIDDRTNRFNWGLLASNFDPDVLNSNSKVHANDGVIHGGEIIYKNFTKNDLLVLSACETGVGESLMGGSESLANSFLRAGSKNIISTLWPVDDEITKNFMINFYTNLLEQRDIRKALLMTKNKFRLIYSPRHWGAFVLLSNQ